MINRAKYLDKLDQYRDKQIIKVITGIRRCGKSTILRLFIDKLKNGGVDGDHIIYLNFEDMANQDLLDAVKAHDFIMSKITNDQMHYVFLDEVQNIPNFQKMVDSLFTRENIDLYITGSNAYFLSSDLATYLSGRYVRIKMLPYSFSEYLSAFEEPDIPVSYQNYIEFGSFPQAVDFFKTNPESVREYIKSVLDTVVYKDVVARYDIKNDSILADLLKYLMDNIGNYTTAKGISDYLTSNGRPVSSFTIDRYLTALAESFVIYPAQRFDIKGKRILKTQVKYYLVDVGIRSLLAGSVVTDYGRILENVVFLELKRRYDDVWVGKNDSNEIDFMVKVADGSVEYYQVALTVRDESVLARELTPLKKLGDNNPKFLLTLDPENNNFDGIKQVNAIDWLLGGVAK
ncbi:ATP-binding protein [Candidatus Saccharibacteria bacterium]|nr:ATP-binding protein [Candidatus Saccharibacteria bacterium]MCL1962903.1 ATP-binding protein [Candidatus Saccharibacteria bacterium]